MASYIMLFRLTGQCAESIKENPARVEAAKQSFKALGVDVKEFYAVMGQYDTVFILEAPDDETGAKAASTISSG